jgi:hypothetical protein
MAETVTTILMSDSHTAKLPNFILAGAPTCGTTSLHHYLCQHPQIYMSPVKEPTYFAAADMVKRDDFMRVITRDKTAFKQYVAGAMTESARYWVTEWADYQQLFKNVRQQIAIGESSVSYIWLPSAAHAIREKLPQARLIFMLRDPADRLFSWYLMKLKLEPRVTLRDRLRREICDGDRGPEGLLRQLDGGMYATHLRRFLEVFPREQIRIYLYDSYRTDAPAVLRDIFGFLGVSPAQPIDMTFRHNETLMPRFPVLHGWRQRFLGNTPLTRWLPVATQRTLHSLYNRPRGHQSMDPEDRQMVVAYYREEILRTQDLIERDLSAWLR